MVTHTDIISKARSYLGAPYLHQGRDKHGIDCVGLAIAICHYFSIGNVLADRKDYPPTGSGVELITRLLKGGFTLVPENEQPVPGDLVLFSIGKTTRVQHVGILTFDNKFIHTNQSVKKVVEHTFSDSWSRRARKYMRFPTKKVENT